MSYEIYKMLHIFGVVLLFLSLGGATVHAINGGDRATNTWRRGIAVTHGLALLLLGVAGFGLMIRLGIKHAGPWPLWIPLKLMVWLLLGGMLVLVGRRPALGRLVWFILPLLGGLAAWLAVTKPA